MSEQLKLEDTDKADKVVEKRENISILTVIYRDALQGQFSWNSSLYHL